MTTNKRKHRLSAAIAAIAFAAMLVITQITVYAAEAPSTSELSSDYWSFGMFCADGDFQSGEAAPAGVVDKWIVIFSDTSLYEDHISYTDEYTYTVKMPYSEYEKLADACFSSYGDLKEYLVNNAGSAYAQYDAADDTVSWDSVGGMGGFSKSYAAMAYLREDENRITVFGVYRGVGIDDPDEDWRDDDGNYVAENIFEAKAMSFVYDADLGTWKIDAWCSVGYTVETDHIYFDHNGDTLSDSDELVVKEAGTTPSGDGANKTDDGTDAETNAAASTGAETDKTDGAKGCGGELGAGAALVIAGIACTAAVSVKQRRA